MRTMRIIAKAMLLSGALAIAASPAWAADHLSGRDKKINEQKGHGGGTQLTRLSQQQVIDLQEALLNKGMEPGTIDGVMGPDTRRALARFQRDHNLKPTGSLNERTAKQLGLEFTEVDQGSGS